jgi:hypothetical protein
MQHGVEELWRCAQLGMAAEDRAGVGEALHVELERRDLLCEQEVVRVARPWWMAAPMRRRQRQGLAGSSSPQWPCMNCWTRSRARWRRLRNALVDGLDLENYYAYHATRADLLRRLGRTSEATAAYERAAAIAPTDAERDFLRAGGRGSR